MTRVDFYILQDVDTEAAQRFSCRLALRAIAQGHPVHLHVDDREAAEALDDLLWHYPEQRFLPHECEDTASGQAPVMIGWSTPERPDGLLVNLSGAVPSFFGRFERVAEVIVQSRRDTGRERYRF
ncbi:MAG: DNA polymerase III subunit chi, partial [Pseudomonadales bacterium]